MKPLVDAILVILLFGSIAFGTYQHNEPLQTELAARKIMPVSPVPTGDSGALGIHKGLYWFQVGAWAANRRDGYISAFSGNTVTGASVEIRVRTPQKLIDRNAALAYWVGINLPNQAFIQVGYYIWQYGDYRAQLFWTYQRPPPDDAYVTKLGSYLNGNGTWLTVSLTSSGPTWSAYSGNQKLGSADLRDSGTSSGYAISAVAEVAGTTRTDNVLGPVEFRILSYRDESKTWHNADYALSLRGYGAGSDQAQVWPDYGVESLLGENNHWLAGSGLPIQTEGGFVWPWLRVTVTSPYGTTSGDGWYLYQSTVQPSISNTTYYMTKYVTKMERIVFAGWSVNGEAPEDPDGYGFSVTENMSISAVFQKQFFVRVSSPYGEARGSGWYDEGSQMEVSVTPTSVREAGFLGQLGVGKTFANWQENNVILTQSSTVTITVTAPGTIEAGWTTNYGLLPYLGLAVIGAIVIGLVIISLKTRSQRRPRNQLIFCIECGKRLPAGSKYCNYCGTMQTSQVP